jgi:hypothetical protein
MKNLDLESICSDIVAIAKEAGNIIRNVKPAAQHISSKKNSMYF